MQCAISFHADLGIVNRLRYMIHSFIHSFERPIDRSMKRIIETPCASPVVDSIKLMYHNKHIHTHTTADNIKCNIQREWLCSTAQLWLLYWRRRTINGRYTSTGSWSVHSVSYVCQCLTQNQKKERKWMKAPMDRVWFDQWDKMQPKTQFECDVKQWPAYCVACPKNRFTLLPTV